MSMRWIILVLMAFLLPLMAEPSIRERDFALVKETYPQMDPEVMLRFYVAHAPDMKEEWERRCSESPATSGNYLLKLAAHFQKLENVREQDWSEYERLLVYEELQGKVRTLCQKIRQLVKQCEEETTPEQDVSRQAMLEKAKVELRKQLEDAFDDSLLHQMREIDRLEAEVRELRRQAWERRLNRTQLLKQRFYALTGQEMPEDKDTEDKQP